MDTWTAVVKIVTLRCGQTVARLFNGVQNWWIR